MKNANVGGASALLRDDTSRSPVDISRVQFAVRLDVSALWRWLEIDTPFLKSKRTQSIGETVYRDYLLVAVSRGFVSPASFPITTQWTRVLWPGALFMKCKVIECVAKCENNRFSGYRSFRLQRSRLHGECVHVVSVPRKCAPRVSPVNVFFFFCCC